MLKKRTTDGGGGNNWSTQNERDYVDSLISGEAFKDRQKPQSVPTKQILENYIASAKKRIEYGTYVPKGEELIKYVERVVAKMD